MASQQAREFAGSVENGGVTLKAALTWHLTANHYPPVPVSMVPVCIKAIEHANVGEWDALVVLPPGVYFRGSEAAPVLAIVDQHHLRSFLEQELNCEQEGK